MDQISITALILIIAVPVIVAITFHEAAHGFVAWKLGDDTAYRQGRVTFNPIRHIDAFGTILLPAILIVAKSPFVFGYAKPVPVDFGRLGRPRRDMVLVAAAGPGVNILLALVSALLLHLAGALSGEAAHLLKVALGFSILINVILAVFNLLPLPPLDGGRIAVGLLPDALALPLARLERYGLLILILVVFVVPVLLRQVGVEFGIFTWIIWPVTFFVADMIGAVTGAGVREAIVAALQTLN